MANFLKSRICNSMVAYLTIASFSTALLTPPSLIAAQNGGGLNFNDINFGIKIEKIYEKVKREIDKGETNKIVGYMFDFNKKLSSILGKKLILKKL